MENETVNLTSLICDSINTIFSNIFSSIDNTICSNLDDILFINTDIMNASKFQEFFGYNSSNGLLLIANSLILGIILFYVLRFSLSHLFYSNIDSPYQFIFKCIIFITCTNSSLWICEKIIFLFSLISDCIKELGFILIENEINFSNLIIAINQTLYLPFDNINIFSLNGILKLLIFFGFIYILLIYSIRYVMCKILILLSPFAFISLINKKSNTFFYGWFREFISLLFTQILVSIILTLDFTMNFNDDNILSKFIFLASIIIIAKCNNIVKKFFSINTYRRFYEIYYSEKL